MSALTLERIRREGEAFMEAISRETYLAHSGLKPTVELQPIYKRYSAILDDDALRFALESFKAASPGSLERRSAKSMLEWELDAQASRALASLEEREVAWESKAVFRVDGREIQYQAAPIEIANSRDRRERLAIDDARAALALSEHAPLRLEYLQGERNVIQRAGIGSSYNESFELVSGISLSELGAQCEAFLADTRAMWDDSLRQYLPAKLGVQPRDAKRADALALFRAFEFDAGFPAAGMDSSIRRQVGEMGIDPAAGGRIHYDLEERAGKHSRAFCAPVRVPAEVYLVLRPHGGQSDYNTLLHELGHALHFAYMGAELPFEFRWLGDNSVTESYAMLFDHRMQDRGWLLRYSDLGKASVGDFLRMAGFEELHFLRRYSAKLLYEIAVYAGDIPWNALPELYVARLTDATGFEYRAADAFIDLDARYYSARYLRAWQLQSALDEYLVGSFDSDWHRNPAAGPWIVGDLFSVGQRDAADEIAGRLGSKLSFQPIIRKIQSLLEN